MSYNSIKPLKNLIVEDNLIDRKQSERSLSKSTLPPFEIKHTKYPENALALPNTDDSDIAIPDLNLSDSRGLDTAGKTERLNFKAGLTLIKIPALAVVVVVLWVVGALVCRYDAASCTHKPDLQVTAAQKVLLQKHILPCEQTIK